MSLITYHFRCAFHLGDLHQEHYTQSQMFYCQAVGASIHGPVCVTCQVSILYTLFKLWLFRVVGKQVPGRDNKVSCRPEDWHSQVQ